MFNPNNSVEIFIDQPHLRQKPNPALDRLRSQYSRPPTQTVLRTTKFIDITQGLNYCGKEIIGIDETKITDQIITLTEKEFEILTLHGLDALKRTTGKLGGVIEKCSSCEKNGRVCDCYDVDLDVPSESEESSNDDLGILSL